MTESKKNELVKTDTRSMAIQVIAKIPDPVEASSILAPAYCAMMGEKSNNQGEFSPAQLGRGMAYAFSSLLAAISPIDFGRTYHVIKGKSSMRADAMLGEFNNRGGEHTIKQRDHEAAVIELKKGSKKHVHDCKWEDIKGEPFVTDKDGKMKEKYKTEYSRKQMLWARCVSDGIRAFDPAVCAGIYTPEEVDDFATPEPAVVVETSVSTNEPPTEAEPEKPADKKPATRRTTRKKDPEPAVEDGKLDPKLQQQIEELRQKIPALQDDEVWSNSFNKEKYGSHQSIADFRTNEAMQLIASLKNAIKSSSAEGQSGN